MLWRCEEADGPNHAHHLTGIPADRDRTDAGTGYFEPVMTEPPDTEKKAKARKPKASKATDQEPIEKQLWKTADKLRRNIDGAVFKHAVPGLVFLKYAYPEAV